MTPARFAARQYAAQRKIYSGRVSTDEAEAKALQEIAQVVALVSRLTPGRPTLRERQGFLILDRDG